VLFLLTLANTCIADRSRSNSRDCIARHIARTLISLLRTVLLNRVEIYPQCQWINAECTFAETNGICWPHTRGTIAHDWGTGKGEVLGSFGVEGMIVGGDLCKSSKGAYCRGNSCCCWPSDNQNKLGGRPDISWIFQAQSRAKARRSALRRWM
jgi:hypothetical protein